MEVSITTLILNAVLILIGIVLSAILLRISARHEYYYGMGDKQAPLRRWMLIILFIIMLMGFTAAVYNLIIPWVFGV